MRHITNAYLFQDLGIDGRGRIPLKWILTEFGEKLGTQDRVQQRALVKTVMKILGLHEKREIS
jgi:hypothetical protein